MQNRQKILEHIQTYPGQTLSQICHKLKIPQSTIKYHLTELINEKRIFLENLFKTHYFPIDISNELKIQSCIDSNDNMKNIYKNLDSKITLDELSIICNTSKSLMSKRLKILISMGAAEKIKNGRKIVFLKKQILN
ncbi:MAG: winged helix-turn-helix transcriptional regulator [Nitrosopumilus sp.]|nr:winged helix-turn-helix transcriptional regulator [Nitrosopumilus sp.]